MSTEKVRQGDYKFQSALEKIISKNIEVIPWEGKEIDENGIIEDIFELVTSKEYSLLHHTKNE